MDVACAPPRCRFDICGPDAMVSDDLRIRRWSLIRHFAKSTIVNMDITFAESSIIVVLDKICVFY
jgi:hypothetical protein